MGKYINDLAMDAALQWIQGQTTHVGACNAEPTTSTQAGTTYALGTAACGSATWTLGAGDTSGRKLTAGAATIAVSTSGTVSHVGYYNLSGVLCGVGTCAPTAVTSGGTVIFAAYDFNEIRDPA